MLMPLEGRRVALIGGAGFVGHNLALTLAARGAQPHVIDSLQVNNLLAFATAAQDIPHRELYCGYINERLDLLRRASIPLYPIDARDYHLLGRILGGICPHVIIHLAAIAHAGRSNKDPYSTFDHSFRTLENALDCSRSLAIEQFIYFSSSMVYGNFLTEAVEEDHPLNPLGIYGALKVGGEKLVIAYNQVFDLPYTILRPSALYGPRCVSRRVTQIFVESAIRGEPLQVNGDGSERLDFTYVDDLIESVCLAMQHPEAHNQIFNVTYGSSRSVSDLIDVLRREFPSLRTETVARDNLMPLRGTLKVDKATRLLNYHPQCPIDKGMPLYAAWCRKAMSKGAAGNP